MIIVEGGELMRRIPTSNLKIDSVIATDVYDGQGRLLIKRYSKISKRIIEHLKIFNILSVYIIDEYSNDVIDDIVSPELRIKAVMELKKICLEFANIKVNKRANLLNELYLENITQIASEIVDELSNKDKLLIQQIDIRCMENYNYSHSINVAIISVILGIELKYDRKKLIRIALAALLHDSGKALLPRELLFKREKRTKEEEEIVRSHCELGYNYLSKYSNIDDEVRLVALNHHEKIDGTGYPRNLKGNEIDEFSKIVSIANYYDNVMASGYMLKENLPTNILEQIMSYVDSAFDYNITRVLFKKVEPFLKGTIVRLNNNDIAVVEGSIVGAPLRPIVKIIKSRNKETINKCINLVDKLDITIVEIVYYVD